MVAAGCFLVADYASAAGLAKTRTNLEKLYTEITLIIPIAATITIALLGLLYSKGVVNKDQFYTWLTGILISGSAAELVAMFYG